MGSAAMTEGTAVIRIPRDDYVRLAMEMISFIDEIIPD